MKAVRFNRHHALYNEGEVAGFDDAHADDLVRRGIASFDAPKSEETAEAPPADPPGEKSDGAEVKTPGWMKKKR